jgi:hypothetical protein
MKLATLSVVLPPTLLLATAFAVAQPGPGDPRPSASGASGPRAGMGMGMGMGRGRFGPDNTPGWAMMSPAERDAHRQRMGTFKTQQECQAYMDEHRKLMGERARERNRSMPAQPRHDPCTGLPR